MIIVNNGTQVFQDLEEKAYHDFLMAGWDVRLGRKGDEKAPDLDLYTFEGEHIGAVEVRTLLDAASLELMGKLAERSIAKDKLQLFIVYCRDNLYANTRGGFVMLKEIPEPHNYKDILINAVTRNKEVLKPQDLPASAQNTASKTNTVNSFADKSRTDSKTKSSCKAYNGDMPFIFLSYSHADSEKAMRMLAGLQDMGCRVWYDEGINAGSEWDENIASHVEECQVFIALISENYLNSANCRDELNFARDVDSNILLVYLDTL